MEEKLLENKDKNLPVQYIEFCDNLPKDSESTWDDFFDSVGIATDMRSNFLTAAILKQAQDILKSQLGKEPDYQI